MAIEVKICKYDSVVGQYTRIRWFNSHESANKWWDEYANQGQGYLREVDGVVLAYYRLHPDPRMPLFADKRYDTGLFRDKQHLEECVSVWNKMETQFQFGVDDKPTDDLTTIISFWSTL